MVKDGMGSNLALDLFYILQVYMVDNKYFTGGYNEKKAKKKAC